MSSIAIVNERFLPEKNTSCPECRSEVEYIISDTNSQYSYCRNCEYNMTLVEKHLFLDKILENIKNSFLKVIANTKEISISLYKVNNKALLKINNNEIISIKLPLVLCYEDVNSLVYIIEYLIEDFFGEGTLKSSIKIEI